MLAFFCLYLSTFYLTACTETAKDSPASVATAGTTTGSITASPTIIPTVPNSPSAAPTATTPASEEWQTRWLRGIPCRAPCWEGITPGVTTIDQAFNVLKSSPILTGVQTGDVFKAGEMSQVAQAYWIDKNGQKNPDGIVLFANLKSSTNLVSAISPHYYRKFTLGEVIKAYGEPSHLVLSSFPYDYDVSKQIYTLVIVYKPFGFVMMMDKRVVGKFELTPQLVLDSPVFFDDKLASLKDIGSIVYPTLEDMRPWEGFKTLEYYCQTAKECSL